MSSRREFGMVNVRRYWAALAVVITLGIGIVVGSLATHGVRASKVASFVPGAKPLADPSPVELSNSFAKIAQNVSPAVVNIRTESTVRLADRRFQSPDGEPGDDFFNRFFHLGPGGPPSDFQQQSLGSGMILDKNGYILTNYHVVMQDGEDKPVDRMRVQLASDENDLTMYPAKLVGYDKWTDLAVIKIASSKPLPTVQLGDSQSMRVGDWVLAIGSPFGLQATVTAGIISAKGRDIEGGRSGEFKRFIQTDAAINPGNSGGPLVSLAGQVVGVNTAIATTRGAYDGVGFAIPSDIARKVYNSIITTGTVRRGAIGVTFMNLRNEALLRSFGATHGVVVESVEPGSPAENAGLQRGDVITSLDGQPISGGDELLNIVSNTEPGKKLAVEYLRDRKPAKTTIVVGDWNRIVGEADESSLKPGGSGQPNSQPAGVLGFSVKDLTPDQSKDIATQLRLPHAEGVLVTDVKPGSFAEDLGVEKFDIILSVNHMEVTSADQFNRLQSALKSGQDVLFLVARRQGRGFTTLFLADPLP
ncbi:MAG: Do family serine endopeptidase [Terriglobia bacterium]